MEQNKIIEKLESIEKLLHEQNVMKKEVMTVEEAIKYLGISLSQIYKLTSVLQTNRAKSLFQER